MVSVANEHTRYAAPLGHEALLRNAGPQPLARFSFAQFSLAKQRKVVRVPTW